MDVFAKNLTSLVLPEVDSVEGILSRIRLKLVYRDIYKNKFTAKRDLKMVFKVQRMEMMDFVFLSYQQAILGLLKFLLFYSSPFLRCYCLDIQGLSFQKSEV